MLPYASRVTHGITVSTTTRVYDAFYRFFLVTRDADQIILIQFTLRFYCVIICCLDITEIEIESGVDGPESGQDEYIRMNSRSHTFNTKNNYVQQGFKTKSSVKMSI
jgi:hypothetical protein